MQIPENTPVSSAVIAGVSLAVPQPFGEGHTCNANEAMALNQLLKENVRNNRSKTVKEMQEKGDADPVIQAMLDKYIGEYEFGVRQAGNLPADPVEREAYVMARDKVKEALKNKGYKIKEIGADKLDELTRKNMEKNPGFLAEAKKIVAARDKATGDISIDV